MGSDEFARRWLAPDRSREWEEATVVGVRPDGADAATLRLEIAETALFTAGQYYLVRIRPEAGPRAVEQAYSVSSSPWPPSSEIELTVRDVPGGRVSPVLVRQLGVGDRLHLQGPFGSLTWDGDDGSPLLMIGAGSGVAPFASIVRFASALRSAVPMTLLCSSRDRATSLLRESLEELNYREDCLSVVHTFTRSPRDPAARYHRQVDSSMIDESREALELLDPTPASLLVAGPPAMVASVRAAIAKLGIRDDRVNTELHA